MLNNILNKLESNFCKKKRNVYKPFVISNLVWKILVGIRSFPMQNIVEIYGGTKTGKTSLAYYLIKDIQAQKGKVLFIDAQYSFDELYAKKIGINTNKLIICKSNVMTTIFEVIKICIEREAVDLIVIDSLAAINFGDFHYFIKEFLNIINTLIKKNMSILFVNQIITDIKRNRIMAFGNKLLKFRANIRLQTMKSTPCTDNQGIAITLKTIRNTYALPNKQEQFIVKYKGE